MPIVNHYARLGKVRMVSGAPPADEVFCATKTVIDPVVKTEVLETNQKLLNAIHVRGHRRVHPPRSFPLLPAPSRSFPFFPLLAPRPGCRWFLSLFCSFVSTPTVAHSPDASPLASILHLGSSHCCSPSFFLCSPPCRGGSQAGDYETYKSLVASDLSAVEDESQGQVVHGLDFHKYYFDGSKAATAGARPAPVSRSEIANPHVRLLSGRSAVVTYTRLVQKPETTDAYAETRVWVEAPKQGWKNVHFHRSRIAAPAGPSSALDLASVASWEELLKSVDDVIKAVDASKPKAP